MLQPVALVSLFVALAVAQRSNEASEAKITNAQQECAPYSYAPMQALAKDFPTPWLTANFSFAGATSYDKAVYAAFAPNIPSIAPKKTVGGSFATGSFKTYSAADPDCWWSYDLCTSPKLAGIPDDVTRCEEPNTWGLTLDDGPNCSHNAYFDYLLSVNQKATLFYIGSNVEYWPLEAQRGLADGHEICAHTWSHPSMTTMTNEQAFAEIYYSKKIIKDILGVTVQCWRPPFGDVDDRVRWIANALDLKTIIWEDDVDDGSYDTVGVPAVKANYNKILSKQTTGGYNAVGTITLSHEIDNVTMGLSESFLPQIQKQFTGGVMPVGVCSNWSHPYVEVEAYQYPVYAEWASGTHTISLAAPSAAPTDIRLAFTSLAAPITAVGLVASSVGTSSSASYTSPAAASAAVSTGGSSAPASTSAKTAGASGLVVAGAGTGMGLALIFGLVTILI